MAVVSMLFVESVNADTEAKVLSAEMHLACTVWKTEVLK